MLRDLRYAIRTLRQNLGFTLVCIISLALGIGATSSIFAVADAILLRPLPVPQPGRLVVLESQSRGSGLGAFGSFGGVSYPDFKDARARSRSFDGLAASQESTFGFAAEKGALATAKFGELVSGDFFQVMRVAALAGRTFRPDEDQVAGRDAVAVVSYELWKNELAAGPNAVGRTIFLNTVPFTIVGVAPEEFTGSDVLFHTAVFVPLAMGPRLAADPSQGILERRDVRALTVRGRLKPGTSVEQAAAEARVIGQQLAAAYPAANRNTALSVETELHARFRQDTIDFYLMTFLMVLAGIVLLIACANVMNLMLSRARARSREIAVRLAIGAGRGRLVRQLLTESLVLAVMGGALGMLVAQLGIDLFSQIRPPTDIPIVFDMRLDPRVLLFALVATAASALVFGLAPAMQATRPDLVPALKSARAEGGKRRRFLGRNGLVIAQIAGSLVLLVFATQAYRGASIVLSSPLGFRTSHLLLATFDPSLARYTPDQTEQFYKRLLEGARSLPGVDSAALSRSIPMMPGSLGPRRVAPEGMRLPPGTDGFNIPSSVVSDGYFQAAGTPIVAGRGFLATDRADSTPVVVVNELFARKYFPNQSAIGKRLLLADDPHGRRVEIVGVAKQSKYIFPAEPPLAYLYLPLAQNPQAGLTLLLQTAGPSGDAAEPLRNLVRSIDTGQPIVAMRTMENFFEQRANKTMQVLLQAIGGLGLLGLIMALVGLYGLMTFTVGLRQREIGIRMAVGADRRGVLTMVLRQGIVLAVAGCCLGLAVTLVAGRPVTGLVGVSSFYLPLIGVVFVGLLATAALGAYVPARRASLLDPNTILRQE